MIDASNPTNPVLVSGYFDGRDAVDVAVAVSGNCAYLARSGHEFRNGLEVIDVSNPAHCVRVGGYGGYPRGVALLGNYAYMAGELPVLEVIDVSDPANPVGVGSYYAPGTAFDVAVSGNYAYVAKYNPSTPNNGGLEVIDVSDPTNPRLVGGCDIGTGPAYDVALLGNYAYVAAWYAGLRVFDVSDPTNCMHVGGCETTGPAYSVAVSGSYAYVATYNPHVPDGGLEVIDVSNPTNCVPVGAWLTTRGYASGVAVSGRSAWLADVFAGLQAIDVSDPTNCVQVGSYNPNGSAEHVLRRLLNAAETPDGPATPQRAPCSRFAEIFATTSTLHPRGT